FPHGLPRRVQLVRPFARKTNPSAVALFDAGRFAPMLRFDAGARRQHCIDGYVGDDFGREAGAAVFFENRLHVWWWLIVLSEGWLRGSGRFWGRGRWLRGLTPPRGVYIGRYFAYLFKVR